MRITIYQKLQLIYFCSGRVHSEKRMYENYSFSPDFQRKRQDILYIYDWHKVPEFLLERYLKRVDDILWKDRIRGLRGTFKDR
ncbi:hypothetical protein D5041_01045 [Verminephrobacter aporrectodeae subsp. tuberculatae]|uniref:Uncharacterized protein n=1 Tax=Verminephrobacter aporrectodeae subsp. tuberculatae TaxID=1110392 RepID=A0ABT3KSG1_9BURK|nr:hypothetical protein [Verminephrobacter aporrectodeae subsp. tuberculatae]MCW5287692.1 hypothetical protein [Verminephrobacter aporrectodeae subsp. tuberculatae]MCW5321263.1 hypothetical protein [Verminephrobacter aporrectodeae subsp. tuberculatae]MCW8164913.1 hypothetical protein [Verminephrobacter aporrectodeae subsp. tuberculatae]MCW8168612.1 hypothetical protein [Verminephrobacter aporrectodeae subsp. tuberculatae]